MSRMESDQPGIVILRTPISNEELSRLVKLYFEDMVKYVLDTSRGVAAVGGEMHADAEEALLEDGSRPPDPWGGNNNPRRGREGYNEDTSPTHIRPAPNHPHPALPA